MGHATEGSPSSRVVLQALADAGATGMLAGDIGRLFTYPAVSTSRQNRVNSILRRYRDSGMLRRSMLEETGTFYHNAPQYRWFITDSGRMFLEAGMRSGVVAARRRQEGERMATMLDARQAAVQALEAAREKYSWMSPWHVREEVVKDLRAAGCKWAEIGSVFGMSRENARIIAKGCGPVCRCWECQGLDAVDSLGGLYLDWSQVPDEEVNGRHAGHLAEGDDPRQLGMPDAQVPGGRDEAALRTAH